MAVSTLVPTTDPAPADLVTLDEASALFAETSMPGLDRGASPRTLKRWLAKHHRRTWSVRGKVCASWTDLIEVHTIEIDRRESTGP